METTVLLNYGSLNLLLGRFIKKEIDRKKMNKMWAIMFKSSYIFNINCVNFQLTKYINCMTFKFINYCEGENRKKKNFVNKFLLICRRNYYDNTYCLNDVMDYNYPGFFFIFEILIFHFTYRAYWAELKGKEKNVKDKKRSETRSWWI